MHKPFWEFGRGDRIRTYDPLVPNQMRYQTALRPERFNYSIDLLKKASPTIQIPKVLRLPRYGIEIGYVGSSAIMFLRSR